jgi:transposase
MKPYSLDLRQRILAAVDEGRPRSTIAELFQVSLSWIRRLVQRRRETGSIAPQPHGGGRRPKLDDTCLERLRELVQQQPDGTLAEFQSRLGEPVSLMTICRALRRLRLPLKKRRSVPLSSLGPMCSSAARSTASRSRTSTRAG